MRSDLNHRHRPVARLDPERKHNNYLTFEHDIVVRARMVRKLGLEDGGDSANDAARVRVVFAGARDPFSGFLYVDLTQNIVIPECDGGHDRYRVKFVVDVFHTPAKNGVHEVREVLVTNPGHTVPDDSDVGGWG